MPNVVIVDAGGARRKPQVSSCIQPPGEGMMPVLVKAFELQVYTMARQPKKNINKALVTGAAGGLGCHVVLALLDAGWQVRATDKVGLGEVRWPRALPEGAPLEWLRFNLERAGGVEALVDGCTHVVHCAAKVRLTGRYADFVPMHVEATHALMMACQQAGVEHVVSVSCGAVYAASKGVLDEHARVEVQTGYTRSKFEAEQIVSDQTHTPWTVLRPAMLYGPGCRTMSAGAFTLPPVMRVLLPYLPGFRGGARNNWCHVEDAASAAVFALTHEACRGRVLNVADSTPLGFGEVLTSMVEAYGLDIGPTLPYPSAQLQSGMSPLINHDVVFDSLRQALRQLWRRVVQKHGLQTPLRPLIDRKALVFTGADIILDTTALRELGWSPRWEDFREGLVPTLRWYQEHEWLPVYDSSSMLRARERERERGFAFNETLKGTWTDAAGSRREMSLDLDVQFPQVRQFASSIHGTIDGQVWAHGLAAHVPCQGTICLSWLGLVRTLVYEFTFLGDRDVRHRFHGTKRLRLGSPLDSLQSLEGHIITLDGEVVGQAQLEFRISRQIVPFLLSLRFLLNPLTQENR